MGCLVYQGLRCVSGGWRWWWWEGGGRVRCLGWSLGGIVSVSCRRELQRPVCLTVGGPARSSIRSLAGRLQYKQPNHDVTLPLRLAVCSRDVPLPAMDERAVWRELINAGSLRLYDANMLLIYSEYIIMYACENANTKYCIHAYTAIESVPKRERLSLWQPSITLLCNSPKLLLSAQGQLPVKTYLPVYLARQKSNPWRMLTFLWQRHLFRSESVPKYQSFNPYPSPCIS